MDEDSTTENSARLTEALAALGNPVRVALLEGIRVPKPLKEIRVRALEESKPGSPARYISRQAVKEHLEKLVDVGVVMTRTVERQSRESIEYVVNHQALYALAERFRDLARLRSVPELGLATIHGASEGKPAQRPGPGLLLVRGLEEGRLFPLASPASGKGRWIVGRRRGLPVALDFDPFVSSENAAIHYESGAYELEDLPHSRNGTSLNFAPIHKGRRYALSPGDVIGVGRCLLVFRR